MIALISTLIVVALSLQVFCFARLSKEAPRQRKVVKVQETKKPEEKKTSLGRPIRIIQING